MHIDSENPHLLPNKNFLDYVKGERHVRWILFFVTLGSVLQFAIFKYYYPFPSYIFGDSYVYIIMADGNPKIGTYPIGYPMFLRLFSVFSKSDYLLVGVQFALLQFSLVYFILTIFRFFELSKVTRIILLVLLTINPVSWYLTNLISSDSVFLSLSLIWFTQLIWVIYYPSNKLILYNAIVLFILFTIRYNALYYPIISISTLLISRKWVLKRVLGMLLSSILIFSFVRYTMNDYHRLSGKYQFSPFSGWQLANNAMYAYRYVEKKELKKLPDKFSELDKMVRDYFDSTRDVKKYPSEQLVASTVYMWDPRSPLSLYADKLVKGDSSVGPVKKWSNAAPILKEYGKELIKTYPKPFIEHYILPNCLKYCIPPVEFLETYNSGQDSVQPIAKVWFNYKSNKIYNRLHTNKIEVLSYFPILVAVMNVLMVLNVLSFFLLRFNRQFPKVINFISLVFILWLTNFVFSVFASPIALRFQLFPILVCITLVVLLTELLIRMSFDKSLVMNQTIQSNLIVSSE